jgi:hypothetical protein
MEMRAKLLARKNETERDLEELDARFQRKLQFFSRYNIPELRRAMEMYNKKVVHCECPACYVVRSDTLNMYTDGCKFVDAFEKVLKEQGVAFSAITNDGDYEEPDTALITRVNSRGTRWGVIYTGRQLSQAYDITDKSLMQFKALFLRLGYEPVCR